MIVTLLMACQVIDPLQERAENAALVCYDNGTLVYASETTVDELDVLLQEWRSCNEAKEKRLAEYQKVLTEHCPLVTSYGEGPPGESPKQIYERMQPALEQQEKCMSSKGYAVPFSDSQCSQHGPEQYGDNWSFVDKGVLFQGFGLKCVPRIPVVTTNKEKK